ncbi:hypothetical protein OA067_07185 [Gammaproteobacteria bacterium]|nr:hypothetical protein [Gammaproteobacteria bacterium]
MGRGKKWEVYDKWGKFVQSFDNKMQADDYARVIGGQVRMA